MKGSDARGRPYALPALLPIPTPGVSSWNCRPPRPVPFTLDLG